MNLRQHRYFVEIASQLSFSRAAERLAISQSALSRQISLLEHELGLKLFDRIGRGISLTPAGHDILRRSQVILNDAEAIQLRARELASGSRGVLRIGSTPPALESLVSRALTRFRKHHENLEIFLTEDSASNLAELVTEGRIDLAVMGRRNNRILQDILEERIIGKFKVCAALPNGHKHAGQEQLHVEALAEERLLLLRNHHVTRQVFDVATQIADIDPRIVIESNNPHSLLNLAQAGVGIAIVPDSLRLSDVVVPVAPLFSSAGPLNFTLSVLWDRRRHVSPLSAAFIDEIVAEPSDNR